MRTIAESIPSMSESLEVSERTPVEEHQEPNSPMQSGVTNHLALQNACLVNEGLPHSVWNFLSPEEGKDISIGVGAVDRALVSRHAKVRMKERDINGREISAVLTHGVKIHTCKKTNTVSLDGLVCVQSNDDQSVITAWRDRPRPGVASSQGIATCARNIKKNKIGLVVGEGGENIRALQHSTGAQVTIDQGEIFISGSLDAIEVAKTYIDDCISGSGNLLLQLSKGIETKLIRCEATNIMSLQRPFLYENALQVKFGITSCSYEHKKKAFIVRGRNGPIRVAERHILAVMAGSHGLFPCEYVPCESKAVAKQLSDDIDRFQDKRGIYSIRYLSKKKAFEIVEFDDQLRMEAVVRLSDEIKVMQDEEDRQKKTIGKKGGKK
jgi:rRNA processing protein Krr1/Pno1